MQDDGRKSINSGSMVGTSAMNAGAIHMVKNVVSEIETWTGGLLNLQACSFSDNPNTVGAGEGVETAADWSNTRRKGSACRGTNGTELNGDQNYLKYVLGVESINLIGILSLAKVFDFGRCRSIFEIGCGDMAQAYVIHLLHPQIRYVATDLDPYVIERCARLPVLQGIEMHVLDVLSISDGRIPFADFDLLMSWGMEYALDDAQLTKLFRMVERTGTPYLMCSATTIGPIQYIRDRMSARRTRALVEQRKLRMTGWRRSLGRFRRLAQQTGLEVEPLGRFGYHFCMVLRRPARSTAG